MLCRHFIVATLALMAVLPAAGQAPTAPDPDAEVVAGRQKLPGLQLRLLFGRTEYELGEPIEATMRYIYTGERKLAVLLVSYDRSGRIRDFGFTATNEQGQLLRDPVCWMGGAGGGLRSRGTLTPEKPYEQKATLNEWLCFDAPGLYHVRATSHIISFDTGGTGWGGPVIPLESDPVAIRILPPDDGKRRARLAADEELLVGKDQEGRARALRDLRFMVDPRALPLLVRGLGDEFGNAVHQAQVGLTSFRDGAPVREAILRAIQDPARVVWPSRMWGYSHVLACLEARAGSAEGFGERYRAAGDRWHQVLADRFRDGLAKLPPREAADATVDGLAGGLLSRDDPRNWRRLLDQGAALPPERREFTGRLIQEYCRQRSLIPALRRVADDPNQPAALRSGASVALHALGEGGYEAVVAADLVLPKPRFTAEAHDTLGKAHQSEVATGLLRLLRSPDWEVVDSAAARIRDYGAGVTAADLAGALRRLDDPDHAGYAHAEESLLEALAMKDAAQAIPFIAAIAHAPKWAGNGLRDSALRLATRIPLPAARSLVQALFHSDDARDRTALALGIAASWQDAEDARRDDGGAPLHHRSRRFPGSFAAAAYYFPELLALYRSRPAGEDRAAALHALGVITGISAHQKTAVQEQELLPRWEAWWAEHHAEYGR
ncbi:MAG: hypothetical protein HY321_10765 [Armatimonadetes bacterium]|nr:hypothetical protein [Armatimonadota bacterium]